MAGRILSKLFAEVINTAISTNTFPDKAKGALVTPVEKCGNDKRVCSNYRPVNVLNTFLKFIKLPIFDQFTGRANRFL